MFLFSHPVFKRMIFIKIQHFIFCKYTFLLHVRSVLNPLQMLKSSGFLCLLLEARWFHMLFYRRHGRQRKGTTFLSSWSARVSSIKQKHLSAFYTLTGVLSWVSSSNILLFGSWSKNRFIVTASKPPSLTTEKDHPKCNFCIFPGHNKTSPCQSMILHGEAFDYFLFTGWFYPARSMGTCSLSQTPKIYKPAHPAPGRSSAE